MDSIIFIRKYETYVDEISQVIKSELQPVLDELGQIDPHDLVTPDTYFDSENSARGLVWKLFLLKVKEKEKTMNGGN